MRRAGFILLLTLFSAVAAIGQPKSDVDYDHIEELAADENRYNELTDRLVAADSTLTIGELQLIYYGQAFRKRSLTLGTHSYNIYKLRCDDKYQEAYEYGERILIEAPASVIILHEHLLSLSYLDKPEESARYQWRLDRMMEAIGASGDGRTPDTAFKVLDSTSENCIWKHLLSIDFCDTKIDWERKIIRYRVIPNEKFPHKRLYIDFNSPDRDDYQKP